MLPKGKDEAHKGLLQSIVALKNNPDFEAVMEYLIEAGQYCAAQACKQPDDSRAKKCAGGFILLDEFEKLVETSEEQLERLKKRNK
jgi:hypothetical protein